MDEADVLSDRVAIIDHGRITRYGSPSELKEKVKSNDIIEIEGYSLSDQIANALQSFSEISKVAVSAIDSIDNVGLLRIHAEKGKEVLPKLLEFLVRKQVSITKVSFIEPTLEDVFIAETGRSLRG
jgi:ABC-2 type transport system ATP-binding protein